MTTQPSTEPAPDLRDPWERFGWLFSAVWLVFLVFPVTAVLTSGRGWWAQGLALLTIVGFAAVYLHGFVRFGRAPSGADSFGTAWRYLLAMSLLAALVSLVIGTQALGMITFLVAFAMFTLPLAWAFAVGGAGAAVALAVPALAGRLGTDWFFVVIVSAVGVAAGAMRVVVERGLEHDAIAAEMALVAERERVARDVHDVLGHSLTVVTVKAELAARMVEIDPARAVSELEQIQSLTREALAEIRATVGGLRVARLGSELEAADHALAASSVELEVVGEVDDVDPRHRPVLAWVLRELVTNVVRHAAATRCVVELGTSTLVVADDGSGLDGRPEGHGLRGVRERIDAAGGRVEVSSEGSGTRVEVRL